MGSVGICLGVWNSIKNRDSRWLLSARVTTWVGRTGRSAWWAIKQKMDSRNNWQQYHRFITKHKNDGNPKDDFTLHCFWALGFQLFVLFHALGHLLAWEKSGFSYFPILKWKPKSGMNKKTVRSMQLSCFNLSEIMHFDPFFCKINFYIMKQWLLFQTVILKSECFLWKTQEWSTLVF